MFFFTFLVMAIGAYLPYSPVAGSLGFGSEQILNAIAASPAAWDRTMRRATAEQIHFSAWQPLPGFALVVSLLGYVLIRIVESTAHAYGLSQYALGLSTRVLLLELIPLIAALFVALRSGAAISTAQADWR